jgi:hypothetical protein
MGLESLFALGNLYATPSVIAAAEASGDNLTEERELAVSFLIGKIPKNSNCDRSTIAR